MGYNIQRCTQILVLIIHSSTILLYLIYKTNLPIKTFSYHTSTLPCAIVYTERFNKILLPHVYLNKKTENQLLHNIQKKWENQVEYCTTYKNGKPRVTQHTENEKPGITRYTTIY